MDVAGFWISANGAGGMNPTLIAGLPTLPDASERLDAVVLSIAD